MVEFTKTIKDPFGLHARPVALLYDIIARHRSDVSVSIGDRHTDGRDVMAFPKTASGSDLMSGAPSAVSGAQLKDVSLRLM